MKLSDNAMEVLNYRYLRDGESPEDMFTRVAMVAASVEGRNYYSWRDKFKTMLMNLDFVPNTPVFDQRCQRESTFCLLCTWN